MRVHSAIRIAQGDYQFLSAFFLVPQLESLETRLCVVSVKLVLS